MSKLTSIIENGEDWHIHSFVTIASDMSLMAKAYREMGPEHSTDMDLAISQIIERLQRLKGQIV